MEDIPEQALPGPLVMDEPAPAVPQAPLPVPGFPGALQPPVPQPTNYREKYLDPASDAFLGNYTNLYHEYSVGQSTPLELRTALYRDGNTGTPLHILLHVRSANAPMGDPGIILGYHRVS